MQLGLAFPMQLFSGRTKILKFCDMPKIKSLVCSKRQKRMNTNNYQTCPLKKLWTVLYMVLKYITNKYNKI